ncbi:MAG: HEAT repeat domain-containing protein [Bacteroidetes bacterium]|nr:MAG: HEAT repeat domain-containing protein [Bacteroidota bacterium]
MKKTLLHQTTKLFFVLVLSLSVFLAADSFGQNQKISDMTNNKFALQNIEIGIQSTNLGVRGSAIYFAGQNRFIETEDALIKQLKVEKEDNIRVLISMALFRMNSEKGMNELKELASAEKNPRVRRMAYAIYKEYLVNKSNNTLQ